MGTADNDFDALSVTDSGVFSDNDACSSGRSSPVSSCKEGVGGDRDRFSILSYDQVKKVDSVLNEMVALEGRGNFPALELKLKDLLTAVKDRLLKEGLKIRDIRLNGGAASYALMEDPIDSCLSCGYQTFSGSSGNSRNSNRIRNSTSTDDGLICSCHLSNYDQIPHPTNTSSSTTADLSLSQTTVASTTQRDHSNNCCCKTCFSYNDIDLIFGMELSTAKHFDRVKTAVLDAILDLLPPQVSRKRMSPCALKEAYVSKMVKVCEGDRWSLIALGSDQMSSGQSLNYSMLSTPSTVGSSSVNGKSRSCSVELKFVDSMRRQYEFSVDSFQIVLDSLMLFYKCATVPMSSRFYPTVVGESVYGDFNEALYHLHHSQMATRHPEEIRGGGLLKYCSLIVRGYRPADVSSTVHSIVPLQRYMCSRFFIDFPEVDQQEIKISTYLVNHMSGASSHLRYAFLVTLHSVVDSSTVCLMGHERRLTLNLIQRLAYQLYANDCGMFGGNIVYSTYYMPPQQQKYNANNSSSQHNHNVPLTSTGTGTTSSGGGFTCSLDSQNQQTIYYSHYTPAQHASYQQQAFNNYNNHNHGGRANSHYHYNNNGYRQQSSNSNNHHHHQQHYNSKVTSPTVTPAVSQIKVPVNSTSNGYYHGLTAKSSNASNTSAAVKSTSTNPKIIIAPPPPPPMPTSSLSLVPSSSPDLATSTSMLPTTTPLLAITASPISA